MRGVPASFIVKTLLLKPNLINELCVVSDKLCTAFIDWEGLEKSRVGFLMSALF